MIDCPPDHPALPGLFDPRVPNNPALWAVFRGRHAGRALVDDLQQPSQCVLRTDAVLTYASCQISQDFLAKVIQYLWKSEPIWLVHSPGNPPAPVGYRILPRREFFNLDHSSATLKELRNRLPDEYTMRSIDRALIEHCEWRDDMAFYCGSLENFLHHGLGMCLMHGEQIITETYASALGSRYAEIGAITHEPYRGRGYAPIAVAFLIEKLRQQGYQAYWSCEVDNSASAQVARKLGFTVERTYEIWEYQPENQ